MYDRARSSTIELLLLMLMVNCWKIFELIRQSVGQTSTKFYPLLGLQFTFSWYSFEHNPGHSFHFFEILEVFSI